MVALVTGNGVGLGNSSANVLGQTGQLGLGQLPGAAGNAYVNASNGNLIIQRQDELLIGRGPDIGVYQTYNSQGNLDFDNNDNWQLSLYRQISDLTGTVNTSGSKITRTGGDGTRYVYDYDVVSGKYINKDGAGSYDTLSYNSSTKTWAWQDGDSRITESYNTADTAISGTSKWRITSVIDLDGNSLTYAYNNTTDNLITRVTAANGTDYVDLVYSTNGTKQLNQINTFSGGVLTTRVSYAYDGSNRLWKVTTELTPEIAGDNKTYVTTYTYIGTSKQIASITNSDGTFASFTYFASGAVKSVSDGLGNITEFLYPFNGMFVVNNANGEPARAIESDANGQLTAVHEVNGSSQYYSYHTNGDVIQVTDNRGNWTKYTYDTRGNQLSSQDNLGNTVTRTYGASNQLLSQTVYTVPDANVSDTVLAANGAQTTSYLYSANGKNQLRFIISAEGRVTEYRYNSNGQVESSLQYAAGTYDVSTLTNSLQDFSSNADGFVQSPLPAPFALVNGALQITSTRQASYAWTSINTPTKPLGTRFSAEITTQNLSTSLLSAGIIAGTWGAASYRRLWVSLEGSTLQLQVRTGGTALPIQNIGTVKANTTYVVEAVTESNGDSTLYFYEKGQPRETGYAGQLNLGTSDPSFALETTSGPGMASASVPTNTIRVDNLQMQMTAQEAALATWASQQDLTKLQHTDYSYDLLGQVSLQTVFTATSAAGLGITDGSQKTTKYVYDQSGNLRQKIDPRGTVTTGTANDYMTSYSYDGLNRLTLTKQYDATGLEAGAVSTVTVYSETNRQVTVTLANGLSVISTYDLAGRLISVQKSDGTGGLGTISYAYDKLNNLRMVTDELGNVTYYLYDSTNRKVGEIDPNKNLTEWVYNSNGQVIRTIQYNSPVTATLSAATALTNTLSTSGIRITDIANDRVARKLYDTAGRLTKEIDALGYVTEYQYDGASRLLKTLEYANALTPTQLNAINAVSGEVLPTDSNTVAVADSTNDRVNRNLYSNDGLLIGTIDAERYYTQYSYDAAGRNIRTVKFAGQVQISGTANLDSGIPQVAITALTGDVLYVLTDNVVARSSTKDIVTDYVYNAAGQLTGMVDAGNYLTTYQYDLAGNQIEVKRYAKSMAGTLVVNTLPVIRSSANTGNYVISNAEDQVISRIYDASNRLVSEMTSNGLITSYTYDSVGNLITTMSAYNGANMTDFRVQQRQYDSRGNLIAELSAEGTQALWQLSNPPQSQIDAIWNSYGTRYSYDNAGRLISKTEPNGLDAAGNKTLYYYDDEGKLRYTINALGEVTGTEYNSFDQVIKTRRYNIRISATTLANLNGGLAAIPAATITALQNGGASDIQLGYDKRGQLISTTDELNNINSRSYNAFGELKDRTDKTEGTNTAVTRYEYDRRGLVNKTTEDYSETNGINRITQAVYDAFGRVTQATDGRGNSITRTFDRLGREVTTTNALSQNIITTYDAFSRVLTRRDGRTNTVTYSYNTATRTMTMTTAEGVVMETVKNQFGETVSITDGRGSITSYQYNLDGQLTQTVEDSGTNKLNITTQTVYDKAGRVFQTVDARGTVTEYAYDAVNRVLNKTVDPTTGLNLKTEYRYDAQGRQIWEKDPRGVWTRMDYDKKGQLTLVTIDPLTLVNTDANGIVTGTSANPGGLNLKTSYTYDARGKKLTVVEGFEAALPRTTQYKYDKLGRLTDSIVDPGNGKLNLTTKYAYDKSDNVVLKTDAKGSKTVYTYDANNRLVYTVDALGYVTKQDYDANGNLVKVYEYSTALAAATLSTLQGAPASTSVSPSINSTYDRVTRYGYDKDNRLTYITDAEWFVTRNEYDANGNVVKRTNYANKAGTISDTGGAPTVTANTSADRVEVTVYDAANRATYVTNAEWYVTLNEYDANGNVVKQTSYTNKATAVPTDGTTPTVAANSANDRVAQVVYDRANRATYQIDALNYVTERLYDANGNVIKSTRFYNKLQGTLLTNVAPQVLTAAGTGNYIVSSSSNDRATVNTWDNAGRLKTTQNGADATITYSYDAVGNRTQALQSGVLTNYVYDVAGRLTDEMRGYGTMLVNGTHYYYDALGNQTGIAEGYGSGVARYTAQVFDALGRKTQVTDALSKTTTTEYNAFGDIVKVTDANNKSGYFYVDKRGLITLQVDPDGAAVGTAYDGFSNATTIVAYANRVTATLTTSNRPTITTSANDDQRQTISYDKLGQKFWVQTYWGTGANDFYTDGYTYNAFGDVTSVKARNGAYTSYVYDKLGRKTTEGLPISSFNSSGVLVSVYNTFNYDAFGNIFSKTEASGLPEARTTSYLYDKSGRLTREQKQNITAFNPVTGQDVAGTVVAVNKTYDVFGRLTTETDAKGNRTWYYYDVLNRQVGKVDASGVYTKTNYDAVGNKASETVYANAVKLSGSVVQGTSTVPTIVSATPATTTNVVYVLEDTNNDRTTYYTYDGMGRVTATEIQNITTGSYDLQTKQYTVNAGNITTQNGYDALGNLIKQVDGNGNITRNWYNNAGQVVAKLDAEGYLTTWTRDVYGNISKETRYATKPVNATANPLIITDSTTLAQITTTAASLSSSEDRITDMTFDRLNRTLTETVKAVAKGSVDGSGVLTTGTGDVITSYVYNGLNKVTQKTDATGAITNYTYDNIGRTTAELRPTFTDFTGVTVRPETAWEYDGLSNVKRELRKGTDNTTSTTTRSGQVESDDQITTYEYGANGLLAAEVDAMGARTEYRYDANGNVTKQTLFGRVDAGGVSTNDVTTFTYDALNRQVMTKDVGTGVIKEAQYNAYGEITGKRTYTGTAPAATNWDEYTQYDKAGKVWKSNSGDGVTKVYVNDKSGNTTVSISGTLNMNSMTLDQVLAQKPIDTTNNTPQQTLYTFSTYDKRSQLLTTVQPSMDGTSKDVKVVKITDTNQSLVVTSATSGNTEDSSTQGMNPIVAGRTDISYGAMSWSISRGSASSGHPMQGGVTVTYFYTGSISLPPTSFVGTGNVIVEVTLTETTGYYTNQGNTLNWSTGSRTNTYIVSNNQTSLGISFSSASTNLISGINVSIKINKVSDNGDSFNIVQVPPSALTGTANFRKTLYISGQPASTSKVLLSYRPAGSNSSYTTVAVPQMINTANAAMSGMYAFDWSSIAAGNYEFQYVALDSSGQILNQQSGTFNTVTPTAQIPQSALAIGGTGRAFFNTSSVSGMASGLQLINQGADAASVTMRYRLKTSSGGWTDSTTSFVATAASTGFGIGSFVLDPAGLGGMTNGNEYDVEYLVKHSSGVTLRTVSGTIKKDVAGFSVVGNLQAPSKLTFTQPATASKLYIRYKTLGSQGAYSSFIILDTLGNGKFEWDPTSLIPNLSNTYDYDFDIEARNADGIVVNRNKVDLRLGATTTQLASQNLAIPQVLRVKPSQTGISYLQLSYRVKGSTADYTALNVNVTASTNVDTSTEYRFELPATLTAGEYEYSYTAYAADTLDANGDTVRNALGSATGYFTAGSTSSASRLDWVIQSSTNVDDNAIKRSQTYNAFGEIISETDGRNNITTYTYNTMGAMTKKVAPTVSITKDNGEVVTNATPTTEYTYDAIGRVIAVKDANGNLNTQVWLAGSSADGNITLEKHADGGIKAAGFDIFGNKRAEYDELALPANRKFVALSALTNTELVNRIDYTYDKENRLVKVERQKRNDNLTSRSTDQYTYDAAGNRISHINAANDTEKTYYDSLGRVTKTTSFMGLGFDTRYSYAYVNNIVGVGGATVSGWQKTTTDATDRTLIDKTDMFNHVTWHQDLGGRQFTYVYNQAGWLTNQTSIGAGTQFSGQNIEYSYYNNGNIKAIHDKAVGMYTYYEYDKDGNRTFEGYISLKEAGNFAAGAKDYYQYARIEYDAMNRMISVTDPKAIINYEYDAVGNRRMVTSSYYDGADGSKQTQTYWYKYDSMNRFLVTMGTLNGVRGAAGTTITRGTTGVDIIYNAASQRTQAINGIDNTTEGYSYTNDGYLTNVTINDVLRSSRTNDALGRVTSYNEFNGTTYTKNTTYDKDNRVTLETGSDGRTDYFYYTDATDNTANANSTGKGALARTKNDSDGDGNDGTGTIVNTYYAYQYWDDAKQFAITNQGYNATLRGNNAAWRPGYSELTYDVNGHINGAVDRSGNRSFRYVNDAQGLILFRDEVAGGSVNRVQRYYYVDGKRVGDVGNDGPSRTDYVQAMANRGTSKSDYKNFRPVSSADFDQNYEPISPSYPGFTASNYTVKNGDTLQSIARAVWGDADMWYLIADANGLTSGSTLTAGQVLTIPNKVTNIHNNSGTYRVYNPGEAIGDVNPTLPTAPPPPKPKKKGGCGGFASIIVMVVAVVATIYTAGALAPVAAGATAPVGFAATMSAGVGALGAGSLGFGAAFAAGAVGSIAGQIAGNVLGVQSGFSWGAVATAGLTSGLLNTGPLRTLTQAVGNAVNGGYAAVAARAVVGNVVGQGIGNITGTQKGFNWSSVAISGIGAVAGAAISDKLELTTNYGAKFNGTSFGADLGRSVVSAGSFALTQLVVKGGKVNWQQVATDTINNLIQNRAESHGIDMAKDRQLEDYAKSIATKYHYDRNNFSDAIKVNEIVDMTFNGRILSDDRMNELKIDGMRRLGATDKEIEQNLEYQEKYISNLQSLDNSIDYPVSIFGEDNESSSTSYTTSSRYDGANNLTLDLDTVPVTAPRGYQLSSPALGSFYVDRLAIGTGQMVSDIGQITEQNKWLKYSLETLDIATAPVAYAARKFIEGTYLGDQLENARDYIFSKVSGVFENAGYQYSSAANGGIGLFAGLGIGAQFGINRTLAHVDELAQLAVGTQSLRSNLDLTRGDGLSAHHLITREAAKQSEAIQYLIEKGLYNLHNQTNGIGLPRDASMAEKMGLPQHIGSHPLYSKETLRMVKDLDAEFGMGELTDRELLVKVKNIQEQLRETVQNSQGKLK